MEKVTEIMHLVQYLAKVAIPKILTIIILSDSIYLSSNLIHALS